MRPTEESEISQPAAETIAPVDRRFRVVCGPDDATRPIADLLDNSTIRIRLPNGELPWRQQVLAIALVDLLGRLFPRINLACDDRTRASGSLPPGPELLVDRLRDAASHGGLVPMTPGEPAVVIHVGRTDLLIGSINDVPVDQNSPAGADNDAPQADALHVDGRGWTSYNGTQPSNLPDDNDQSSPIGPLAAACRAAAQVTQLVLGHLQMDHIPPAVYASALTYTVDTSPSDTVLDTFTPTTVDAILVGAGSVGGAAVYTLARVPRLEGVLVVADPQRLEDKNLDRALLATSTVTVAQADKAHVVAEALRHHAGLTVTPWVGTIQTWVASQPRTAPLPMVLAAVDTLEARRAIQDCLPLDLINAACHPTEIQISGHRTGDGPCVCCLHMQDALDSDKTRKRLLERETGLPLRMIEVYLTQNTPLDARVIHGIEVHRQMPEGSLAHYLGRTLEELRVGNLLYGATPLDTASALIAVAAPYVTALAGVLLAGEGLKAGDREFAGTRLGPSGSHTKYAENPIAGPMYSQLIDAQRWPGTECLCQSARRTRMLIERYGL